MKKFSFNLESILVLRERDDQNARATLTEANAYVERVNQEIARLESSISGAYDSWDGQSGRRFTPMDRIGLSGQVAALQAETMQAKKKLQAAHERRAKAIRLLQEASRNRKVVTNLKEKRLQAHTAELLKREANEIEDIFNARRSAH